MSANQNAGRPGGKAAEDRTHRGGRTEERIHLLSVGSLERSYLLHDSVLLETGCRLSVITDYQDLWTISEEEVVHLAILQDSLSSFELEEASRFVRRHWPQAKILVIHSGEDFLEDALYDDRVEPAVPAEDLLKRIEQILGGLA